MGRCQDRILPLAARALEGPIEPPLLPGYRERFEAARRAYLEEARGRRVYGYCTGLGELQDTSHSSCRDLEEAVLEEHSVQAGPEALPGLVRLFLTVRLLQLQKAPAPLRPVVAERLAEALRVDALPVIRLHGSVGASGDLSPSSQAARCLYLGRGLLILEGRRLPCSEVFDPLPLEPGESLALINNTAWSTSLCLASLIVASRVASLAGGLLARAAGLVGAPREHYEDDVLSLKNCPSGLPIAAKLRERAGEWRGRQAPYSIRCVPQILGPVVRVLGYASQMLVDEACASTENPSVADGRVLHQCNFHSARIALACDMIQGSMAMLSSLLERAASQVLVASEGRPRFLAGPGSSVGAMIVHYTMAALSARVRSLAARSHLYTTPTSGLQEDIVPMTPEQALLVHSQLRTLARMLAAMELVLEEAEQPSGGPLLGLQERLERLEEEMLSRTGARHLAP